MVDLAALVIGSLFVAIGVTAAVAALSARPRVNRNAGWFAVFCVLYGLRLAGNSALVQAATRWPDSFFQYADAFITYTILVPATLFVESLAGPGTHTLLRRTWQGLAICGLGTMLADLFVQRPYAAMWLNTPLVLITIGVWFAHFAARAKEARWTTEVRAVAVAGAILVLTAIYETVANRGLLDSFDVEPLATLLFTAALGWLVLTRAREQEYGFVALSRELELARSIQQSLLPRRMPEVPGLRIEGFYLPMSAVAGDLYDVLPLSNGRILAVVADVSGHGVPAALVASMLKVALAAEADRYDRPGDILTGINRALTGKFEFAYVTACCVVVDRQRRSVAYALAGHPPPLLRRAGGRIEPLAEGGIMLTLMPSSVYATTEVAFEPGDRLLLYTDGLTEATRANGDEFFGDLELTRVLASTPLPDNLMREVQHAHRRWIGDGAATSDDISVVVIDCVE